MKRTRPILLIPLAATLFASAPATAKHKAFDASPNAFGLLIVDVKMRSKELFTIDLNVDRGSIVSAARSDSLSTRPRLIEGKETAGYLVFAIEPGRYRLVSVSGQTQVGARTIGASARFDVDYLVAEVRAGDVAYLGTVDVRCVPHLFSAEDECQVHLESHPERMQTAFERVANKAKHTAWEACIRRRASEPPGPWRWAESAGLSKSTLVRLVGYGLNNNVLFLSESGADSGEWGVHPRIWLELANGSDRALWALVRLTAPFADRVCEHRLSLERRERSRTLCTQDSVVAGVDYAVKLAVFADSGFADTLETSSWSLRLERSDVEEWESFRRSERGKEEPKERPRSYGFPVGMVSDSSGGAIVVWAHEGGRRAQHVLASGEADRSWPTNGQALGNVEWDGTVADGAGGALVTWVRGRGGNDSVYVQHLLASGTFDPAWPSEGRVVCTVPGDGAKSALGIIADGTGGAIAVWLDDRHRATDRNGQGLRHIYAQHVMANGMVDSLWPAEGRAVFPVAHSRGQPTKRVETGAKGAVVSDGVGGAIVTWEDIGGFIPYYHVYAQHLLANGTADPRWPRDGLRLCRGNQQRDPAIVSDGAGGAVVAWEDGRKGMWNSDIYAQHVLARGVLDRAWPADGLPVCNAAHTQDSPEIASDGAGGALITWQDGRAEKVVGNRPVGFGAIYVQHVLAGGRVHPAWPENGRGLLTQDRQGFPAIVADGTGGAIVTWSESPGSVPQGSSISDARGNVCAQHVLGSGQVDPAWPTGSAILSVAPHQDFPPIVVADGAGGVMVAFTTHDGIEVGRVRAGGQPGARLVVRH